MKGARRWISVVVAVIVVFGFSCPLMALDADVKLAVQKLREAAGDGKWAELAKANVLFKESGLTYQESLRAPQEGVIDCKDRRDQLQVLVGIYMFDVQYAAVFGKRDAAAETLRFVQKDVMERLELRPKIKIEFVDPAVEKRYFEGDPANMANREALFAQIQANFDAMIKAAENDPELLDYLVDQFFGVAVEFTYLSSKLALGAPGGEKLIPLFNMATARIDTVLPVLDALQSRKLQALMHRTERSLFLNAVKTIIAKKGGNLDATDLRNILILVEPVRNSYVAKCK